MFAGLMQTLGLACTLTVLAACTTDTESNVGDGGARTRRDAEPEVQDAGVFERDAGTPTGSDGGIPGAPIVAPPNTWTYVPMNDFICGNGTPSGISVNLAPSTTAPLVVFMMGGGACWSAATCMGGTATNLTQFVGEAEIAADLTKLDVLFDRSVQANPFREASLVFIPYCTGDVHAGDAVRSYSLLGKNQTVHHKGAKNLEAVISRLVATMPSPSKLYVTGASAGGFGTLLNYHRFRTAYPNVRIDVLNDSGTPVQPIGILWKEMQDSWKMTIPPGCTGCDRDATAVLPWLASAMDPTARLGILSYTEDEVIRGFTGTVLGSDFERKVLDLRGIAAAQQKFFIVKGKEHVVLRQKPMPVAPSGVTAAQWVAQFATDDPAWSHQGP